MASIGDRWASRQIDVGVEHRASIIVSQVLAVISTRISRTGAAIGSMVLGCAPGERHALPVRIVAEVVRLSGFEVDDLGADVPASAIRGRRGAGR